MKTPRIVNAVGQIDDDLITAAAESKNKRADKPWVKWVSVAACFAVLVIAASAILPSLFKDDGVSPDKYKYSIAIQDSELGIVWPWEYLTLGEKYYAVKFNGKNYSVKSSVKINDTSLLGNVIGTCEAQGVDHYTDKKYSAAFDVRKIIGVSEEKLIAVGKDTEFYVYILNSTEKPDTFGEMLELYGLPQTLKLYRFSKCKGYNEKGYFSLNDDSYIWQILAECKDAKLCDETDSFDRSNRKYLAFTATSEALGAYKQVIYISEDGYFATNIFNYSHIYFIGKNAAEKIIRYAENNSEKAEFEPYELTVSGTLTEIENGYVLIDDTVLCANEADGTVYKIFVNDIKMRRCIECTDLKVGDTVAVKYKGEISDRNEINGAYSICKGTLVDGNLAVPE